MTVSQNQRTEEEIINAKNVVNYLQAHPEFFNNHPELLADIHVPHATGATDSLIERQVSVLRDQNRHYRHQLEDLVKIARENDKLIARIQHLTLNLLDTNNLNEILALIHTSLVRDFQADAMTLCLFSSQREVTLDSNVIKQMDVMLLAPDDEHLVSMQSVIDSGEPVCGKLNQDVLDDLFGSKAAAIRSAAQLPLISHLNLTGQQKPYGLLAIGSQNESKFHAAMGTVFLRYLGDLVSRKLQPFFIGDGS
ncbi:MAG: DUF484 family protein [Gammaproteobacteria bacterium]